MINDYNTNCDSSDDNNMEDKMQQKRLAKPKSGGFSGLHITNVQQKDYEVENAEAIRLYDNWKKTGSEDDRQAYFIYLCLLLEPMFLDHQRKYGFQSQYKNPSPTLDCLSEKELAFKKACDNEYTCAAFASIALRFERYDPRRSMPSTFFGTQGDEAMRTRHEDESGPSTYYKEIYSRLNKAAQAAGHESAKTMNPTTLHYITGISLQTVMNTLSQFHITVSSYNEEGENGENVLATIRDNSNDFNPERRIIHAEQNELAVAALKVLTPYELFILTHTYLEEKRDKNGIPEYDKNSQSYKHFSPPAICAMINTPEMLEALGLDKCPDPTTLSNDIEFASQKVRREYTRLTHYDDTPIVKRKGIEAYEQADIDEIEAALLDDIVEM